MYGYIHSLKSFQQRCFVNAMFSFRLSYHSKDNNIIRYKMICKPDVENYFIRELDQRLALLSAYFVSLHFLFINRLLLFYKEYY